MKRSANVLNLCFMLLLALAAGHSRVNGQKSLRPNFISTDTTVPVKIQLEKTFFKDMPVVFISDTAVTTAAIGEVLGRAYGELVQCLQQNQLPAKKFIAWYYSMQAPWRLDVAIETDSMPGHLSSRVKTRIQTGGDVLIAHMWGPYDQVSLAYAAIQKWLKENNRRGKDFPFEVYLNDPASVKSPSEIQTDVYQPLY